MGRGSVCTCSNFISRKPALRLELDAGVNFDGKAVSSHNVDIMIKSREAPDPLERTVSHPCYSPIRCHLPSNLDRSAIDDVQVSCILWEIIPGTHDFDAQNKHILPQSRWKYEHI